MSDALVIAARAEKALPEAGQLPDCTRKNLRLGVPWSQMKLAEPHSRAWSPRTMKLATAMVGRMRRAMPESRKQVLPARSWTALA